MVSPEVVETPAVDLVSGGTEGVSPTGGQPSHGPATQEDGRGDGKQKKQKKEKKDKKVCGCPSVVVCQT